MEQMLEKLGCKGQSSLHGFGALVGTAEAFIKAHDYFEEHKDKVPEEDWSSKAFLLDVRSAPRR